MTYDATGKLTTLSDASGLTQFGWDARQRLVSLIAPETTTNFSYDPLGRRVGIHLELQNTSYIYDRIDVIQDCDATSAHSYLRTLAVDQPLARGGTEFYLI